VTEFVPFLINDKSIGGFQRKILWMNLFESDISFGNFLVFNLLKREGVDIGTKSVLKNPVYQRARMLLTDKLSIRRQKNRQIVTKS